MSHDALSADEVQDKLADLSKETVDVDVDSTMLKQTAGFLAGKGSDSEKVQELLEDIRGIYVKSFEFGGPDAYSDNDVELIRKQVSRLKIRALA